MNPKVLKNAEEELNDFDSVLREQHKIYKEVFKELQQLQKELNEAKNKEEYLKRYYGI